MAREETSAEFSKKTTRHMILALVHVFCLAIYLIPILTHSYDGTPVLDELHIVSKENHDVRGNSELKQVFLNDYWGRPMTSTSSHKSWRPLTVLTFRWLASDLFWHRVVNVVTHAATGELVSIMATLLFPLENEKTLFVVRVATKLVFCLHPTHVEVTANAANRNHLLAVLCSSVLVDPRIHILWILVFQTAGLLCSETFLFQLPAIMVTMTVIAYQQRGPNQKKSMATCVMETSPRHFLLITLSFTYLIGRHVMDTLSIPEGLIRPAENPFYEFKGMRRVRNYAYVLAIHIFKSMGLDFVGFSHEYGFECLREIKQWSDVRVFIPVSMLLGLMIISVVCWKRRQWVWLVHLSWLATLFPISGFVKVGTFVADRIVVASTVSFSIFMGRFVAMWIVDNKRRALSRAKTLVVAAVFVWMWVRVHNRTMEWMDSVPLLQRSLRTCPRSAKSNLEMSKVHSGLYPKMFNLTRSRELLEAAELIDPDFCDVHQQFAHVAIQEGKYLEFEERLVKGIMCPFSMSESVELWRRYWPAALKDPTTGPAAQARYEKFTKIIEKAISKEKEKDRRKKQTELLFGVGSGEL